jgi:hypothetical protein
MVSIRQPAQIWPKRHGGWQYPQYHNGAGININAASLGEAPNKAYIDNEQFSDSFGNF